MDECEKDVQRDAIANLIDIQRHTGTACKILISSRVESLIKDSIVPKCHISLNGRTTKSLNLYIKARVSELQDRFPKFRGSLWDDIEQNLKCKAGDMFLWVRLVISMLKVQISEADLEAAVDRLPNGLEEAYGRIIARLRNLGSTEKDRAFRILFWVCTAERAVSIYEVADGISLKPGQSVLSRKTRSQDVNRDILEICAPLLERSSAGTLELVHFSAKEYLLDKQTGPFVDIEQANFNTAFACVVNLNSTVGIVPRYNQGDPDEHFERMLVRGTWYTTKLVSCFPALFPIIIHYCRPFKLYHCLSRALARDGSTSCHIRIQPNYKSHHGD